MLKEILLCTGYHQYSVSTSFDMLKLAWEELIRCVTFQRQIFLKWLSVTRPFMHIRHKAILWILLFLWGVSWPCKQSRIQRKKHTFNPTHARTPTQTQTGSYGHAAVNDVFHWVCVSLLWTMHVLLKLTSANLFILLRIFNTTIRLWDL